MSFSEPLPTSWWILERGGRSLGDPEHGLVSNWGVDRCSVTFEGLQVTVLRIDREWIVPDSVAPPDSIFQPAPGMEFVTLELRLENVSGRTAQLMSRRWEIVDSIGETTAVDDLTLANLLVSPLIGWDQDQLFDLAFGRESIGGKRAKVVGALEAAVARCEALVEVAYGTHAAQVSYVVKLREKFFLAPHTRV